MKFRLPAASAYTGPDARERRYLDYKRIREGLAPCHTGGPARLTAGDLAALAEAAGTAMRTALRETIPSRTTAPPPRTPDDTDDRGSGDAYTDRGDILLGNHARTAPRSYSLSDLTAEDGPGLDFLTSGAARYTSGRSAG